MINWFYRLIKWSFVRLNDQMNKGLIGLEILRLIDQLTIDWSIYDLLINLWLIDQFMIDWSIYDWLINLWLINQFTINQSIYYWLINLLLIDQFMKSTSSFINNVKALHQTMKKVWRLARLNKDCCRLVSAFDDNTQLSA